MSNIHPRHSSSVNVVSFPDTGSPPKLLDRVRQAIQMRHYSRRTESTYVHWIRRFIVFHQKKHPNIMGAPEITAFLSWLATEQHGVHARAEPRRPRRPQSVRSVVTARAPE